MYIFSGVSQTFTTLTKKRALIRSVIGNEGTDYNIY